MDLRQIKKEVELLSNINVPLKKFQQEFIRPLSTSGNIFVSEITIEQKKEFNKNLNFAKRHLVELALGQNLTERIRQQAHYLIELKLAALQQDKGKQQFLQKKLLHDDLFNFQGRLEEVKALELHINALTGYYEEINNLLTNNLSLENSLLFLDYGHKNSLGGLKKTMQKQKELVYMLGKEFIAQVKNNGA